MKNIITFQPGDINEILGVYDILKSYNKTSVIIVDSYNAKRLISTNMKYVLAGAGVLAFIWIVLSCLFDPP